MKPTIQLRLGQQLTMTPQLQQAIRLLQLSTLDLKQEIQDVLESNVMLEIDDDSVAAPSTESEKESAADERSAVTQNDLDNEREVNGEAEIIPNELPVDTAWDDQFDVTVLQSAAASATTETNDYLAQQSGTPSLHDHLMWQLNLTPLSVTDTAIANALIDGINDDGYLTINLEELLADMDDPDIGMEEITAVLHRIQRFDPPGVAARSAQECLILQLEQLPVETPEKAAALTLLRDDFEALVAGDEPRIRRLLGVSSEQVHRIVELIRSLNPRPGSSVATTETSYVEPDVFVTKRGGRWQVELNPDTTPKLKVNREYAGLIRRADNSSDNTTLKDHLQEARWFIKSLQSRNQTLLRVASKIVEFQQNFFNYGEEAMKPLVLRNIAEALDMHESTISRVTSHKYMHTPRGTLEFKYFFSSQIRTDSGGGTSATAIRALIKKLIVAEKPEKPLSDNKIATLLSEEGIKVARRTVAKYREAMAIPPSNERKRLV